MMRRSLLALLGLPLVGDGLVRPQNAPVAQQPQVGVQPGTTGPIVRANTVIVFGPTGAPVGIFIYRQGTTPSLGNPPVISITQPGATQDPYGNTIKAGAFFGDTNPARTDYILIAPGSPPVFDIGTGDAAEGAPAQIVGGIQGGGTSRQLELSLLSPGVTGGGATASARINLMSPSPDGTQNATGSLTSTDGAGSSSAYNAEPGQTVTTAASVSGTSTLTQTPAPGGFTLTDDTGFSGTIPVTQSDVTQLTAAAASFTRITTAWPVPANNANTGTCYRLAGRGSGTQAATTAVSLLFDVTAFGVTLAQVSFPATFAAARAGFVFNFVADVTVRVTGAAATIDVDLVVFARQSGTSAATFQNTTQTSTVAVTNAAETVSVAAEWSSVTNAPTLTCNGSTFERIGA